uniref:Uncharacterized protein n=1 Tax=Jakoba libera TaxID=143017 RepID=M4QCG7_JAKLI|nr:hypothetical protein L048_p017 [Jakoba libera]AGH24239.1 hypothetical protein [Jakoba libera]
MIPIDFVNFSHLYLFTYPFFELASFSFHFIFFISLQLL